MKKRGQIAVFIIVGIVMVMLVYLTFLDLNAVKNPVDPNTNQINQAMISCAKELGVQNLRVLALRAGHSGNYENIDGISTDTNGDFVTGLNSAIKENIVECTSNLLPDTIEFNDEVNVGTQINPKDIMFVLKINAESNNIFSITRYDDVIAKIDFSLKEYLDAVKELDKNSKTGISLSKILALEEKYGIDIYTTFD